MPSLHGTLTTAEVLCLVSMPLLDLPPPMYAITAWYAVMPSLHGTLSTAEVLCLVSMLLLLIIYKHLTYIRVSPVVGRA